MKNVIAVIIIVAGIVFASISHAESIELEKRDYLMLIVGNYVHGFKEFDTSVVAFDDSVSVGIYYDAETQDGNKAETLADRFRKQLPRLLAKYEWANEVTFVVNVYGESGERRY